MTEKQVEGAFHWRDYTNDGEPFRATIEYEDPLDATGENVAYAGEDWDNCPDGPVVDLPQGIRGWLRLGAEIVLAALMFTGLLVVGKLGWEVLAWLTRL